VVNFDLPNVPEAYVHRIGRTGRAGFAGRAMSFCEAEERPYLADIERLIQKPIPAVSKHPYPSPLGIPPATDLNPQRGRGGPSKPAKAAPSANKGPKGQPSFEARRASGQQPKRRGGAPVGARQHGM
jgi:ATP-dependent RNA helicase RhlE